MKKLLLRTIVSTVILIGGFTFNAKAFTAVTSGMWSSAATWGGIAPGANVSGQDIIIPAGMNITLDMSVNFSGLINTFSVDGSLTSTTSAQLTITQGSFSGTGTVDIHRLEFGTLASSSFTGDLTLNVLENNGTFLSLGSVTTVSDTLSLEAGNLSLAAGSNLELMADGIIRRNAGTIAVSGGVFNNSNNHSIIYVGSTKTSGPELNSIYIQNLYLQLNDNSQTLLLNNDLRVNTALNISAGQLNLNTNNLELYGNLTLASGSMIESSSTSNILIESSSTFTSGLVFAPSSAVNNLTINYSGGGNLELHTALNVTNELRLIQGTFSLESGSTLLLNTAATIRITDGNFVSNGGGFDGSADYNVIFDGGTHTTGLEFTGAGLNDVTVDLNTADNQIHFGGDAVINGHLELKEGLFHLDGFDLSLDGTVDQEGGASFKGDPGSELELNLNVAANDTIWFDPANQVLDKLTLNLSGAGDIVLGNDLTIASELNFMSGIIDIAAYDLTIEDGGMITGNTDMNYVRTTGSGRLGQWINTGGVYRVFPIGSSTNYSPCAIQQQTAGTAGYFYANVFNGVYSGGTTGTNLANTISAVDRTWQIETGTGFTYNMNLKLGWLAASEVNGFDRTDCYISHYMGGWDNYTSSAAVVGLNNTYETERTGITSLSPFTVTDANGELGIPSMSALQKVHVYPNPASEQLTLDLPVNTDAYQFELSDMSGRLYEIHTNGSNQLDISYLDNGVYFILITNSQTGEMLRTEFVKH